MILNINKDDSNLNDFMYCWDIFKSRPNRISINQEYETHLVNDYFKELKIENTFTEIISDYEQLSMNDRVLIKISDDIYLSYVSLDKNKESSISVDFSFLYKNKENLKEIEKIINDINDFSVTGEISDTSKLGFITINNGYLKVEPIDDECDLENVETFYSEETIKSINKLIKNIKKNKKGISILYGDKGTGKTSIIKYLSNKLDNSVIYIQNNMIDHTINNPEFNKFIKKNENSILVIDDCEFILNEFYSKSNIISNNLIQLTDGLIPNNVNIITIFNTDNINDIDESIVDSNSLIDIIEFKYLSELESNELSKHLGQKVKYKNKTRLIDIIKKNNNITNKNIGLE
jgi:uncharacterized protein YlbG (UPF0298 family)